MTAETKATSHHAFRTKARTSSVMMKAWLVRSALWSTLRSPAAAPALLVGDSCVEGMIGSPCNTRNDAQLVVGFEWRFQAVPVADVLVADEDVDEVPQVVAVIDVLLEIGVLAHKIAERGANGCAGHGDLGVTIGISP